MAQLTQLEENNLKTQANLMNDIISNYNGITYSISQKAKEVRELLRTRKRDQNIPNPDCVLSYETFEKIEAIIMDLADKHKWTKLGVLAEHAVPDNELKLNILKQLQENI